MEDILTRRGCSLGNLGKWTLYMDFSSVYYVYFYVPGWWTKTVSHTELNTNIALSNVRVIGLMLVADLLILKGDIDTKLVLLTGYVMKLILCMKSNSLDQCKV